MPSATPPIPRTAVRGSSRLVAYDFGAHLSTWELDGRPVVWCSEAAVLDGSKAIRGGVPVCFPWFAAGPDGDLSPSHGVARTASWHRAEARDPELWAWTLTDEDVAGSAGVEHLPGPFRLRYAVSVPTPAEHPSLRIDLEVTNPGAAVLPVEAALHTYLAVHDVRRTEVLGLEGAGYLDKTTGRRGHLSGPLRIEGPTDAVVDSPGLPHVEVVDRDRRLVLETHGSTQTVVWNPGAEQAAEMSDLQDDAWRGFLCVETASTGDHGLRVPPGGTHTLGCTITVHDRSADRRRR
ncbi:D-hexose-6-phosphate mutarotase [uncultured Serinicoccus sp.]|uniref:D-hexose-6-phosphate mutarotase n=1 Tax=uncultured Serinicoccus sp. TaxID=735514 RepID=UPI0026384DC3|nr:D-hexose-6-phosphate mutarotase [uncultured Serinicoccus sp.]